MLPVNAYGVSKLTFEGALHASRPNRAVSLRRCAFFLSLTPSSPPHMSRPMFPIYIYITGILFSQLPHLWSAHSRRMPQAIVSPVLSRATPRGRAHRLFQRRGANSPQLTTQLTTQLTPPNTPTDVFTDEAPINPPPQLPPPKDTPKDTPKYIPKYTPKLPPNYAPSIHVGFADEASLTHKSHPSLTLTHFFPTHATSHYLDPSLHRNVHTPLPPPLQILQQFCE